MTAWPVKRGKKNGIKLEMIIQDELSKCYRFKEVAALTRFFVRKRMVVLPSGRMNEVFL